MLGLSSAGAVVPRTSDQLVFFSKIAGCEGKLFPPWGAARQPWNNYLKGFGLKPSRTRPWLDRGRQQGFRWIYTGTQGRELEVLEKGGLGLALVLSLGSWKGEDPQALDPVTLAKTLQGFCPPQDKPGCPEGGVAWTIPGSAMAVLFRPPEQGLPPGEEGRPATVAEPPEEEDELILMVYGGGDVSPCGEKED